jgi:hypothetical protein
MAASSSPRRDTWKRPCRRGLVILHGAIHASRTTSVVAAWARTCGYTGLGHEDNLGGGGINNGRFRSSIRMRQAAQLAGERWTAAG